MDPMLPGCNVLLPNSRPPNSGAVPNIDSVADVAGFSSLFSDLGLLGSGNRGGAAVVPKSPVVGAVNSPVPVLSEGNSELNDGLAGSSLAGAVVVSGLSFAGTEKSLRLLISSLDSVAPERMLRTLVEP